MSSVNDISSVSISNEYVETALNVIFIKLCLTSKDNETYFWNIIRAIIEIGHNVTVISDLQEDLDNPIINELGINCEILGNWIPKSIFGFFPWFMYIIRSIYTAIYICWNSINSRNVLVCDNHYISLPILEISGCKIIFLNLYRQIFSNIEQKNNVGILIRLFCDVRKKCMKKAEVILAPCENICERENEELGVVVIPLYIPAEGEMVSLRYRFRGLRPRRDRNRNRSPGSGLQSSSPYRYRQQHQHQHRRLIFLAVGSYTAASNFTLIIDAYARLVNELLSIATQRRYLRLVIVGSATTPEQHQYFIQLNYYVMCLNVNVILHNNLPQRQRFELYQSAFAVLNANEESSYVPSILEAFYFARLVITVDSPFVSYIVFNDFSGIIINADSNEFALTLYNMLTNIGPDLRLIAYNATEDYQNNYSFDCFVSNWQIILS